MNLTTSNVCRCGYTDLWRFTSFAYILDQNGNRLKKCQKMVIASFRPGYITPEQFIYAVSKILDGGNFSRILFNSTAHLGMRYPENGKIVEEDTFHSLIVNISTRFGSMYKAQTAQPVVS